MLAALHTYEGRVRDVAADVLDSCLYSAPLAVAQTVLHHELFLADDVFVDSPYDPLKLVLAPAGIELHFSEEAL